MKTSKELFERLNTDEAFAAEFNEKAIEKLDAGEKDSKKILIPLAAEYVYELTDGELDEIYEAATAEMSDEEIGKVAGGTTPICYVLATVVITGASVYATLKSGDLGPHSVDRAK